MPLHDGSGDPHRTALESALVQSAMDAIIATDEQFRIIVFNPAAEKIFRCSASDVIGQPIDRFIPSRFRDAHDAHVRRFAESGVTRRTIDDLGDLRALRADGVEFPIEASISQTEVGGRKVFTVIVRDETERTQAHEALRESEERFRLIADSAPVMLWMSGTDKLCTYFNRAWLEFTGRPLEAELGYGWAESVHPDDVPSCVETYVQAFDTRRPFTMTYRMRRHDGEYRWIRDSGVARFTPDGTFAGYAGSAVDVTTQKLAQTALADANTRLVEAHESERKRVARELHDDIGQRVAVLTIDLDMLNRAVPLPVDDLRDRIRAVADRSRDLARDIQAISYSLHSSKLDYMGIAAAAASFCAEISDRHGIAVEFTHQDMPADVSREAALCLFRVLQEAVTNAVRHAGVQHISAALQAGPDAIGLEVVDAGRGFDLEVASRRGGLGLVSMRERLTLVDGELSISSRPGAGTTVRARVPLRRWFTARSNPRPEPTTLNPLP